MSPEAILSVGVSAANVSTGAASPGPAAGNGGMGAGSGLGSAGAGAAASGSGNGGGSGSSDASSASGRSGAAPPQQDAQTPKAPESGSPQRSGRNKSASAPPRARSGSQTKNSAPLAKNFSQALAQSLATPATTSAAPVALKVVKPAAQPAVKAHTPDPVSAAMAMMGQAVPITAHPVAAGKTSASGAMQADGTNGINAAGLAVESTAHKLVQTKALTQITGAEAHTAPTPAAPSGSTAQLVSAGQLAAGVNSAVRPAAAAPSAALSAPVGSSSWNDQLGTQLTWMVSKGVQNASLQMAPQHLGPVQVSISVHHGQASVWFGAAQPETRQALSQALPQLRAMFASQGLTLTDSGVSQDAPRDSRRAARPAVSAVGEVGAADASAGTASIGLTGAGLIDTYA